LRHTGWRRKKDIGKEKRKEEKKQETRKKNKEKEKIINKKFDFLK